MAAAIATLPAGRRLRILEIGAGTGGTTAAVLPRLPAACDYVFTDVSAAFLTPAREKFAAYDFIEYRALDIERDPLAQGLPAHGFDLVLSANALHATADLRRTLGQVQQLLAPSGLLVILEATRRQHWVDVTFGALEGWWKFADTDLRPDHPLLPAAAWRQLLAEVGFTEASCLPADDAVGQAVVLAHGPATVAGTYQESSATSMIRNGSRAAAASPVAGPVDGLAARLRTAPDNERGELLVEYVHAPGRPSARPRRRPAPRTAPPASSSWASTH